MCCCMWRSRPILTWTQYLLCVLGKIKKKNSWKRKWAVAWDFQQFGMCDQQMLRPACAHAQTGQSLYWSLKYFMTVKLLSVLHLRFLQCKHRMRLHRLVWIYNGQNATMLEITCHGSNISVPLFLVLQCKYLHNVGNGSFLKRLKYVNAYYTYSLASRLMIELMIYFR